MNQNLREFIDMVRNEGYTVGDVHGEDQYLIDPLGDAVETWRDDFEPQLGKSLTDEATLIAYESEIESFTQIVKELNLNRKIW